jgi:UDP-N-acetylmuramate--alanine ligase
VKYHLIGINGVSMSGLAKLLLEMGNEVSGCDLNQLVTDNLKLKTFVGHSTDHITKDLDGVVVTSAALHATSPAREEIEYANKIGVKIIRRSQLIGQLMNNKIGIAIAGMHGKTTTSSMLAHILVEAGHDPTFLVGGEVRNIGTSEKLGNSKYFVAEACEYEKQFLDFRPKIAIITNIEEEHLDTYTGGIKEIKQTFKKFIKLLPKNGLLVLNQDDKNSMSLMKSAKCKIKRVTIKKPWPGLKLQIPGDHILLDATMAARVAHEIGISSEKIKEALNSFTGAKRRFEVKGTKDGITVVDDYGHHPTEIEATLKAAKEWLNKTQNLELKTQNYSPKLIVVFRPHQYLRTKALFKDFVKCFSSADKLIIGDIKLIAGREPEGARADFSKDLVEEIKKKGVDVSYIPDYDDILTELKKTAKTGDMILTLGATDIYKVGEEFLAK